MQLIRIQCQHIVLQTVVIIKCHLSDCNIAVRTVSGKAYPEHIALHRLCQLHHIIFSAICIGLLQHGSNLCRMVRLVILLIVIEGTAGVADNVFHLGKGDIIDLVLLVKGDIDPLAIGRIYTAFVPVRHIVIGGIIIIHHAQCRGGISI